MAFLKVYEYEPEKNMQSLKEVTNFSDIYRKNFKTSVKNAEELYRDLLENPSKI